MEANGTYTFPTRLGNGTSYKVAPTRQPGAQACHINNDRGTINAQNVTNIGVVCEARNLTLVALQPLQQQSPSIIRVPVSVNLNRNPALPIDGLSVEDFEALESGDPLTVESFVRVEPITNIPFVFETVLMLDVSSSITLDDVENIKTTARNFVADATTGESRLLENQRVTLRIFDGGIRYYNNNSKTFQLTSACGISGCPGDSTRDIGALLEAIDAIERGGSSTNLYGAIQHGAGLWNDFFNINQITFGAMILVTDGDDTSGIATKENAITAVANKTFFAVPVGSAVNLTVLEEIAGAENIFPADDYEQLNSIFEIIDEQLARQSDGKYLFYYASPKRSGTHELRVSLKNNSNTLTNHEVVGTFNASSFSDIDSERAVVLTGPERIFFDEPVEWRADTRWSNDPANYTWTSNDPGSLLLIEESANGDRAVLSTTGVGTGTVNITVTDNNWSGVQTTRPITVRPSRIPTGLTAQESNGEINIYWQSVPDATQHNLYWSTTSGAGKGGTIVQLTGTGPYLLGNLHNGTVYYFAIASLIDGVESQLSDEVSAQPRLPTPGSFILTPGETENQLSWSAVSGATGYTLYWNTTGDVTTADTAIHLDANATGYTHVLPDSEANYYYRLTARDSTSESQTTVEAGLPPTPVLTAEAGDREVTLDWTPRTGETYALRWSTTQGASASGTQFNNVSAPYTHTGRTNNTTLYYTLTATNSTGSVSSTEVSATPIGPWVASSNFSHQTLNNMAFANSQLGLAVGNSGYILRTTDGGASWVQRPSTVAQALQAVTFIDTENAVAGGSSTLLYSDDAGLSWQQADRPAGSVTIADIAFNNGTGIAVGSGGTIWRSIDQGQTWTARSNPQTGFLYTVTFTPSGEIIALGQHTAVRSTDDGLTWQSYSFPFNHTSNVVRDITFISTSHAVAVGHAYVNFRLQSGIWKTEDGGENWTLVFNTTSPDIFNAVSFSNHFEGKAVGLNGAIWSTLDGGDTWVSESSDTTASLIAVYAHGEGAFTAAGGMRITRTREGHTQSGEVLLLGAWSQINSGTTAQLRSIARVDDQTALIAGLSNTILKTQNGGGSWAAQTLPGSGYHLQGLDMADASHGIAVGTGGTILVSSNGGQTWATVPSGTTQPLQAVQFIDEQTAIAVGNAGTVIKTTNRGLDWSSASAGITPSNLNLRGVHFVNANTGFIVGGIGTGISGGSTFRTDDGGESWTALTLPTTSALHGVYFSDADTGYVVGYGTVLYTEDGGINWENISPAGYSNTVFQQVLAQPEGVLKLVSSSSLSMILASTDNGETYSPQTLPFATAFFDILALSDDVELAVGESGRIFRFLSEDYQR